MDFGLLLFGPVLVGHFVRQEFYCSINKIIFVQLRRNIGLVKSFHNLWSHIYIIQADGYLLFSDLDVALKLFDEMPNRDMVIWNSIISNYASRGMWENFFRDSGRKLLNCLN